MASITTNTDIQAGAVHLLKTAGSSVLNMFRAVGNFFVMLAETNSRAQAVERLNAMSDAQLAAQEGRAVAGGDARRGRQHAVGHRPGAKANTGEVKHRTGRSLRQFRMACGLIDDPVGRGAQGSGGLGQRLGIAFPVHARARGGAETRGGIVHIRQQLGRQLRLRFIPEIHFEYDASFDYGQKIEKLLSEIKTDEHQDD